MHACVCERDCAYMREIVFVCERDGDCVCLCVPVNERVRQIEKIRRNAVHDTFYGYVFSFSYAL